MPGHSPPIRPEETLTSETVYEGKVIRVRREMVRTGTEQTAVREIVEHAPVVVMAPVATESEMLFVRQYRKPVEQKLIELPAGGVEPGESLEEAVRREMEEETGYVPRSIEPLATIYPTPGISDEVMHIFRVADLEGSGKPTEKSDELRTERIPLENAAQMVRDGRIQDAKSAVGVLMLESLRST